MDRPKGTEGAKCFHADNGTSAQLGQKLRRWAAALEKTYGDLEGNRPSKGRCAMPKVKSCRPAQPTQRKGRSPFRDSALAQWQLIGARLEELRAVRGNRKKSVNAIDVIMGQSTVVKQEEAVTKLCGNMGDEILKEDQKAKDKVVAAKKLRLLSRMEDKNLEDLINEVKKIALKELARQGAEITKSVRSWIRRFWSTAQSHQRPGADEPQRAHPRRQPLCDTQGAGTGEGRPVGEKVEQRGG